MFKGRNSGDDWQRIFLTSKKAFLILVCFNILIDDDKSKFCILCYGNCGLGVPSKRQVPSFKGFPNLEKFKGLDSEN